MNTVTAQDFRDLKVARIKGSLNARIIALEKSMSNLTEVVEALRIFVIGIDVDEDTPDEYNRVDTQNYGGTK
jgi:hypothetical protein